MIKQAQLDSQVRVQLRFTRLLSLNQINSPSDYQVKDLSESQTNAYVDYQVKA